MSVLLAQGASRHQAGAVIPPAAGNANEISAARDALRQVTERLGEDHPMTALMLRNLALAMQEGGYSNYAESYARQALAIFERHFGAHDPSLVPVLNVLAEAAVSQGRYGDARELEIRAVAIGPDAGPHYGTALHNLAAAYQAEGRFEQAAGYYRQALAARQQTLPAGHPYIRLTRAALDQVQRSVKTMARR